MLRTRRFPRRFTRWTSLFICFTLLSSILIVPPLTIVTAKAPRNLETTARSLNPQSASARQRQPAPRDAGKKVDPIPPERGAPAANLPNLDQLRVRKPEKPKAPPPIPSTMRSRRKAVGPKNTRAALDDQPAASMAQNAGTSANLSVGSAADRATVRAHHARRTRAAVAMPQSCGAGYSGMKTWSAASPNLGHQMGHLENANWVVTTGTDAAGYMVFGPYVSSYGQGHHKAQFMLQIDNNVGGDVLATLDVVTGYGANTLASRQIHRNEFTSANQWQIFTLEFDNPCSGLIEARVYWNGTAVMKFREVNIGLAELNNLSLNKAAIQSSTYQGAGGAVPELAVDGTTSGIWTDASVTATNNDPQAWWQVDLGGMYSLQSVEVWNRTDCCGDRLTNFNVILFDDTPSVVATVNVQGQAGTPTTVPVSGSARYVRIQLVGTNYLSLAEVKVWGGAAGASDTERALARLDPFNQTGNQLQARDVEWSLPLVSLPGRAGLDLGLSLSYSSLVWTRAGSAIYFDEDNGTPSPGFRLGFPTIGDVFFDTQANVNARLMIMPSGRRVELRQVSAGVYQSADSSYLELRDYGGTMSLFTTDGTQMDFAPSGGEWHCTTIRDRNGNRITATYNAGDLSTVTDTLGRVLLFNYDGYGNLQSVTQNWSGQTHTWATFGWGTKTLHPSFNLSVFGASEGEVIPVLTQVGLPDGSRYNFEYTDRGQISVIRRFTADGGPGTGDDVQRGYTGYDYQATGDDCPRISAARTAALNWTLTTEVPAAEVTTTFEDLGSGWHRMSMPDGTQYTELYGASGWQRGMTSMAEVWSSGVRQKWTTINYTQDNTGVNYQANPRVIETIVDDAAQNHLRTTIDYGPYAQYGLPYCVTEYANNGSTELRRSYTDYNLSQQYLERHIIGLVSATYVQDPSLSFPFVSKTVYVYDNTSIDAQATAATQHDQSFNRSFLVRGNVTSISRWDVTNANTINDSTKALKSTMTYNAAGSVLTSNDPSGHQNSVAYGDNFSDGNNSRNTFAYPTTVTDADQYTSTVKYNFDFGGVTERQTPQPNTTQNTPGAVQTLAYDGIGRLQRVTLNTTGAYQSFEYYPEALVTWSTVNNASNEALAYQALDGFGRTWMNITLHPGSSTGRRAQWTKYDKMNRVSKVSNPAEIDGSGAPAGDDAAGWVFTQQTYDWKGRPLRTTHPDGYYTEASYTGCGCAGGEVTSVTDEAGRQRRTTTDVLGRLVKTEEMNWEVNGARSVYSTANYAYNGLDQITSINHEGQVRSFAYDGYGRLQTRTTPEQGATTYSYFNDGSIQTVTDARGATATYGYNNRHLPININYNQAGGVAATANVSFGYDAAGNRTSMTDGLGSMSYGYDQLSRMTSETRTIAGVGAYQLSYNYNLANELTGITNPWGIWNGYSYDNNGRLKQVYGDGQIQNVTNYVWDMKYRAFDAVKSWAGRGNTSFSATYDNRMRPTSSNTSNRMGYNYSYFEGTGRVSYARNVYDGTLDRSYEYDQVGALVFAHSGSEARAAFGIDGTPWGNSDGPYSHMYDYDQQGNMTSRYGWGGEVQGGTPNGGDTTIPFAYTNNKRNDFNYDAAGNVTSDGVESYSYDATSQQRTASDYNYLLSQGYDGDGLRGVKTENGAVTYYLRASVLGGAVVAEINGNGGWQRGYVYGNGELIAVQQNWQINWVHEDPVSKSKRVTDVYGNIASVVELDPWGAGTNRSSNSAFMPQNFTSYIRDANGDQDAMARRYDLSAARFSQPDPYGGSYDFSNPQSFNRYAYVGGDPVNRIDPSGLITYDGALDPRLIGHGLVGGLTWAIQQGGLFAYNHGIRFGDGRIEPYWSFAFLGVQNPQTREQRLITETRNNLVSLLNSNNGNNPCAQFFGGAANAIAALNAMPFAPGQLGNYRTGISMNIPLGPVPGGTGFIVPNSAIVNTRGGFYQSIAIDPVSGRTVQTPNFGGYGSNNNRSRAVQMLHELGHVILTGRNANGTPQLLLPPDGPLRDPTGQLSEQNTRRVVNSCRNQIKSIRN